MRKNWNFKAPSLKAINIFKTLNTTMQSMWILKTMGKRRTVLWFQDLATEHSKLISYVWIHTTSSLLSVIYSYMPHNSYLYCTRLIVSTQWSKNSIT